MKIKLMNLKLIILGLITFVLQASGQEVHRSRVSPPHERVNRTGTVHEEERFGRGGVHTNAPHYVTPENRASARSSADRMARNIIAERPKVSTELVKHYNSLQEPRTVAEGRKATPAQKARILAANRERNGGEIKSDMSGKVLAQPEQARKGVKANIHQAEIDHIVPRSKGGSNSNSNMQVVSKAENLKKGAKQ